MEIGAPAASYYGYRPVHQYQNKNILQKIVYKKIVYKKIVYKKIVYKKVIYTTCLYFALLLTKLYDTVNKSSVFVFVFV